MRWLSFGLRLSRSWLGPEGWESVERWDLVSGAGGAQRQGEGVLRRGQMRGAPSLACSFPRPAAQPDPSPGPTLPQCFLGGR